MLLCGDNLRRVVWYAVGDIRGEEVGERIAMLANVSRDWQRQTLRRCVALCTTQAGALRWVAHDLLLKGKGYLALRILGDPLLRSMFDVNVLLGTASACGLGYIVQALLDRTAADPNFDYAAAFTMAVWEGRESVVRALLPRINVDRLMEDVLLVAARRNNSAMLRLLLTHPRLPRTAELLVCVAQHRNWAVLHSLVMDPLLPRVGLRCDAVLCCVCRAGHIPSLDELLRSPVFSHLRWEPILWLALEEKWDTAVATRLLAHPPVASLRPSNRQSIDAGGSGNIKDKLRLHHGIRKDLCPSTDL